MSVIQKNNYFVITGAPGIGKSSLLNNLRSAGYGGNDEPARKILSEQLVLDGPGLPSKNPQLFIRMMQQESTKLFEQSRLCDGPIFFIEEFRI
ncbi:MAG: AAA family ATPase [Proteobacteria bacterium]|nr:AAA family ATPase [Pseudomonadota bacterium]